MDVGETKKRILVIGSINMDMIVRVADIPMLGETVLGEYGGNVPGGKGANQACAAAKLSGQVTFLGKVGDDANGLALTKALQESGCNTEALGTEKGCASGFAIIEVTHKGNNSIIVVPGANACCDKAYIAANESLIAAADMVMLQLEIPMDAVEEAARLAKKHGKQVLLNPAPAAKLADSLLTHVDYITPNENELATLTGCAVSDEESAKAACRVLHKAGVSVVLATLGSAGALYSTVEKQELFPARRVTPVDTTAAGDTFNGAFAVALAEGKPYNEAVRFANIAASISVTRGGAQSSIPTREETDAALQMEKNQV